MKILHKTKCLMLCKDKRPSGRVFYRVRLYSYPHKPGSYIDWDAVDQFAGPLSKRNDRMFSNRADAENFMLAWEMSI